MGNCQAIDAATLVIQHPSGRVDKLYWPVTASEVMRTNPGHYVALVINLAPPKEEENKENRPSGEGAAVRVTRVKLLKPTEILVVGQAYRLITSKDVMKGLWAKKYAKMKKTDSESTERSTRVVNKHGSQSVLQTKPLGKDLNQVESQERHQQRTISAPSSRSRPWRPSLQSISEADFHANLLKQQSL